MKKRNKILLIVSSVITIILLAGFYLFTQTDEFIFLKVKFETCPYGHHSLKAVPILYGLPAFDSTLEKQIEDKELYLGGCVVSEGSPRYKVICTKCGFELTNYKEQKYWERHSSDVNSFQIPLQSTLLQFPLIGLDTTKSKEGFLNYTQELKNDAVIKESLRFTTVKSILDYKEIFKEFSNSHNIVIQKIDLNKDSTAYNNDKILEFRAKYNNIEYIFEASEYVPNDSLSFVSLTLNINKE